MSIDWGSILLEGFLESIPLISKFFTTPYILCIGIFGLLGGAIFKNKEGSSVGAFIGFFVANSLGFLN